jgi:flagellar assembly protein FliH
MNAMVKPVKFNFDTPFDEPAPHVEPAAPPPPTFTLEELEAARAEATAAGIEAGEARARAALEAAIEASLAGVGRALGDLLARQTGMLIEIRADAAELAHAIAAKLAPTLVAKVPLAEIETMIEGCLGELAEEPRIVIRLADQLVDALKARIDGIAAAAGFPGQIVLLGDPSIEVGDARVEWAHGGAERNTRALASAIEAAVARFAASKRFE